MASFHADDRSAPRPTERIRAFLKARTGMKVAEGKEYLLRSRLEPVMKRHELGDFRTLAVALDRGRSPELEREVVEAMTINETSFYRDRRPFDALETMVLPRLIAARRKERRLRFWSAASSTGQEAYSLAMLLLDTFPELRAWSLEILATDVDESVLQRAEEGVYGDLEIDRGLPDEKKRRWFRPEGRRWRIGAEPRELVTFKRLNLIERWPPIGPFDVVFCRNVLIYFDVETKRDIVGRIRGQLAPDGYLLLGGAETTIGLDNAFEPVPGLRTSCYRRTQRMRSAS